MSTYSTNGLPYGSPVVTRQIIGTGTDTFTNAWFYDTELGSSGYGRPWLTVGASGAWERFTYDTNGRLTKVVSQFQNGATNAAENISRVREFDYTAVHTNDVGTNEPNVARTVIEKLYGSEIARTYTLVLTNERRTIQCLVTNAPWNHAANLVTITKSFALTNGTLETTKGPDGTVSITRSVTNLTGWRTNISYSGQPATGDTNIVDGTITTTISDPTNRTISSITIAYPQNFVTDSQTYTNFDAFGRPQRTVYLDGSSSEVTYSDCCGFGSSTDREGTTITNVFDPLKRLVLTKNLGTGIAYSNTYDAVGYVVRVMRVGSDNSEMTNRTAAYNTAGRMTGSGDGIGNPTTVAFSRSGGYNLTITTYADGGTRIEKSFQDGSLYEVTGTAVHPFRRNFYGSGTVNGVLGYAFTEVKLTNGVESGEWTRTVTDMAGRTALTLQNDDVHDPGETVYGYNSAGQLTNVTDPDSVSTLYLYNAKGENSFTVVDMDRDGVIDWAGTDRITWTTNYTANNGVANVRRSETYVWASDGNTPTLVSVQESAVNGLATWSAGFGVTNRTEISFPGGGVRYSKKIAPDGTFTTTRFENGRVTAIARTNGSTQLGATTFSYDSHGRQTRTTDARNGTMTNWYDNADRLMSVATPAPASGQNSQVTSNLLDGVGRVWKAVQPDGTALTNQYFTTGALQKRTGSRTYPVQHAYDDQGRMISLRTWRDYAGNTGTADTVWRQNSRGKVVAKTYADNSSVTYSYTAAARLYGRVWARGVQTGYSYNYAGDVGNVYYDDGTPSEAIGYDRRGRLASSVRNSTTTNVFTHHEGGPVTSETQFGVLVTNRFDEFLRRTNVAVLIGSTVVASTSYSYNSAGRLSTVTDGTNSATYSYVANSPLVSQIVFASNSTTRMTTIKSYDYLNRLTLITNNVAGASAESPAFAYALNSADQRTGVTNFGGGTSSTNPTHWLYGYDALGQVTNGTKRWNDSTLVLGQQFGYSFDDIGNRRFAISGGDANGLHKRLQTYSANNLNQYTSRTVPGYLEIIGSATNTATVSVNNVTASRRTLNLTRQPRHARCQQF